MAYPFVPAKHFTRGAMSEARAILWHMAEGYGTVGYFTRVERDVSSHYVIERTGRIVQMVRHTDASHSAHWQFDSGSSDASSCGGLYDPDVAISVLGAGWRDLNRYSIAVEVEGYRAEGPNAAERASIVELAYVLRMQLPTLRGNLGHRDVQDYKACPGCKFPWATIAGHGRFRSEDSDMVYSVPGIVSGVWPAGSAVYDGPTGPATGRTLSSTRRLLIVGQDRPDPATRYLVDGAGDGTAQPMAWLAAKGAVDIRSESFDAGVAAAAAAALTARRG